MLRLLDPFRGEGMVGAPTPVHGGAQPIAVGMGQLGRPVAASAAADDPNATGVEIGTGSDPVEDGVELALGVLRAGDRRLTYPRHVDGEHGQVSGEERRRVPFLFEAV